MIPKIFGNHSHGVLERWSTGVFKKLHQAFIHHSTTPKLQNLKL